VQIGMTLPCMVRGLDRKAILSWCRGIDAGPFVSLAVGERVTYHSTEMRTLLAAAAALTERVRIVPTLYILPMHPTAIVAKEVASLDVLSNGRVTITVGVGGREHDYRAAEKPFKDRFRRLDQQVAELRRLWAGEPPFPGADPIGPPPVQPGGPPIWSGAFGPKSLRRAAAWADGVMGFSTAGDPAEVAAAFELVRAAWRDAGASFAQRAEGERSPSGGRAPRLVTGFWYALGPGAEERLKSYVHDYLRLFGDGPARAMADRCRISSAERFRECVEAIAALGADELLLVPTTADPAELDRTADALAGCKGIAG
jgi:alkanesulfonate monooxygenase SsuD/methylene tetrahydromethanopterin reductase-like flavin-dependent oxidoreductase (luciferase family)